MDEVTAHGVAAVKTGSTLAKFLVSWERVAETAEYAANVSKSVAGVSTIFHLIALTAQGGSMFTASNRRQRVVPIALGRIVTLLRFVMQSMTEIMKLSRGVNEVDTGFVFDVLIQTVSTMDLVESQLMRMRSGQIMNGKVMKEMDEKLEDLFHMLVTATSISKIVGVDEKVIQLEEAGEIWDDAPEHLRPSLSPFFSGRTMELDRLRGILEKWGSTVISQYGGVGKTELMIALADRAERDKAVQGGVFWVTADGGERDVIESLAGLAEKLIRRKMEEEERRNPNLVVAALKQGLDKREGRWLLCLDNADSSKLSSILNEVCSIADGTQGNGWVVVTSRQGQPYIWGEMKSEQKLVLKPLCAEDAMVVLWRQIRRIGTEVADDDEVMGEVKELERIDADEYHALKELCGDDREHSLGGLPLALQQAGMYIRRSDCSFREYLNMFMSANRKEDLQKIIMNMEELKAIRESQRSIWTTWKISVKQLSETGYAVLQAMAMQGQGCIGEAMMKGILKAAAQEGGSAEELYESVVVRELMHGSSLIWRDERRGEGSRTYEMHRLVRRFILNEMVIGQQSKNGRSRIERLLDVFSGTRGVIDSQGRKVISATSILEQTLQIRGAIHGYGKPHLDTASTLNNLGLEYERKCELTKAQEKYQQSLDMTREIHGDGKPHPHVALLLSNLGRVYMKVGNLDEALEKHKQSLEVRQTIHGKGKPHLDIVMALCHIGEVYHMQKKLNQAADYLEKSLEMLKTLHGQNPHPSINAIQSYLAKVHKEQENEGYKQMQMIMRGTTSNRALIRLRERIRGTFHESQ